MLRRDNPYLYLAATVALVFLATAFQDPAPRVVAGLLGVATAVVAVVMFVRERRDPNGPPGQH